MKALSIKQPWAYMIAVGIKDVENRTWKTNFRGRILIHASKAPDKKAFLDFCNMVPIGGKFHYGAIIGNVNLIDCVKGHNSKWAEPGLWNWVFEDHLFFSSPIIIKGQLGLWETTK